MDDLKMVAGPLVTRVAFFGYASSLPEDDIYNDVYIAARYLAERGYVIVNGGGPGLMDAATKGAESGNGDTLTVTFDPQYAPGYEGRFVDNKPDKEIKTTNYIERMFTLMKESDYFVIFNGGTGTLSEFATAWVLAKLYKGRHKGFTLYGNQWRPVVDSMVNYLLIQPGATDLFDIASSPAGVIQAIKRYEFEMAGADLVSCDVAGDEAPFMACKKPAGTPPNLELKFHKKND